MFFLVSQSIRNSEWVLLKDLHYWQGWLHFFSRSIKKLTCLSFPISRVCLHSLVSNLRSCLNSVSISSFPLIKGFLTISYTDFLQYPPYLTMIDIITVSKLPHHSQSHVVAGDTCLFWLTRVK